MLSSIEWLPRIFDSNVICLPCVESNHTRSVVDFFNENDNRALVVNRTEIPT